MHTHDDKSKKRTAGCPKGTKSKTLAQGRKPGSGLHGKQTGPPPGPKALTPDVLQGLRDAVNPKSSDTDKLVDALSVGCPLEIALQRIGIARSTYYTWLKRAEDENDPAAPEFREFFELANRLTGENVTWHLRNMKAIADGSKRGQWLPSAWALERTRQDIFAIKNQNANKIEVNVSARDILNDANDDAVELRARQLQEERQRQLEVPPDVIDVQV